jgi:cell division protein FtsI (penicillin-binding protein 3)
MAKEIIARTAALLDVKPRFGAEGNPQFLVNY